MLPLPETGNQKLSPEPQISVVIPSFRRPVLLKVCLGALALQTAVPDCFEVIVVTDGPDAGTVALVSQCVRLFRPGGLRIFSLGVKSGPAAARNYGWKHARGGSIIFTDDDCVPDSRMIEAYKTAFRLFPGYAFTGKVNVPQPDVPTDYEKNIGQLQTAAFITANCGVPKDILRLLHGFDERFPGAWREDSEFHFKLLKRGIAIRRLATAVVHHPVRPAAWGISLKEEKKNRVNALLYRTHPVLYRRHISSGPVWNYYRMLGCAVAGIACICCGSVTTGLLLISVWVGTATRFAIKRLDGTSRRPGHITEMIFTSLFIPFFSVYWSLYGAVKYRTLFIN